MSSPLDSLGLSSLVGKIRIKTPLAVTGVIAGSTVKCYHLWKALCMPVTSDWS